MPFCKRTCIFVAGLIAALLIPAFGQSTSGELVGTIYDQAGAVIPDATDATIHSVAAVKGLDPMAIGGVGLPAGNALQLAVGEDECDAVGFE